ncbi:MAG: hypothetical protein WB608_10875 [Terracidiphilus sp.]
MDIFKATAPFFCVLIVFWIAARVAVADAARDRTAVERENGRIEFFPNRQCFWGIYVILAFISYPILMFIATGFKSATGLWLISLCSGCILLLLMSFPGSIYINADGLEQTYWVGSKKRVPWKHVAWIGIDDKKKRVTVKGSNGHKIVHTRQLPDKARFLAELRTHCPTKMPAESELKTLIGA